MADAELSAFSAYNKSSKKLKKKKIKKPTVPSTKGSPQKVSTVPIASSTKSKFKNAGLISNISKQVHAKKRKIISNASSQPPKKPKDAHSNKQQNKKKRLYNHDEQTAKNRNNVCIANGNKIAKTNKKSACEPTSNVAADRAEAAKESLSDSDGEDQDVPELVPVVQFANAGTNGVLASTTSKIPKLPYAPIAEENDESGHDKGKKVLEWLLNPMELAEFFDKCWEKGPVHIKRHCNRYFRHLFSSDALDSMLRDNYLQVGVNVDVVTYQDGERVDVDEVDVAKPSLIYDYYNDGHSIRVKDPQTFDPKIRHLLTTLQEYFGAMVGANVYLTPAGSQGFAPHYDDIEAFIIQLEGRKHWKLYKPPMDFDLLARFSSKNFAHSELGAPIKEITVEAGDVLYFPRGVVHEACTDANSHSLHLTVSTYQRTSYVDLLEQLLPMALKQASTNDVAFRRGLPVDYLRNLGMVNNDKNTQMRKDVLKNVKNLLATMMKFVDVDAAVDVMGKNFIWDSLPPVHQDEESGCTSANDGDKLHNGRVYNKGEIAPNTRLRLLRYHCVRLVNNSDGCRLYHNMFNGGYREREQQFLEIDLDQAPIIESLLDAYPEFKTLETLPSGNMQAKLDLCTVLWQVGLLVTEESLESIDGFTVEEVDDDGDSDDSDDTDSDETN